MQASQTILKVWVVSWTLWLCVEPTVHHVWYTSRVQTHAQAEIKPSIDKAKRVSNMSDLRVCSKWPCTYTYSFHMDRCETQSCVRYSVVYMCAMTILCNWHDVFMYVMGVHTWHVYMICMCTCTLWTFTYMLYVYGMGLCRRVSGRRHLYMYTYVHIRIEMYICKTILVTCTRLKLPSMKLRLTGVCSLLTCFRCVGRVSRDNFSWDKGAHAAKAWLQSSDPFPQGVLDAP